MRRVTPSRFQYYQVVPMVLYLYTCTCTYMYVKVSSFYLMFYNLLYLLILILILQVLEHVWTGRCAVQVCTLMIYLDMMCTCVPHRYRCVHVCTDKSVTVTVTVTVTGVTVSLFTVCYTIYVTCPSSSPPPHENDLDCCTATNRGAWSTIPA
jgi:hypothetical protein